MSHSSLAVGCGSGFSGDRTDAAIPVVDALIRGGGPAVLIYETLAERTVALAQMEKRAHPERGYEPMLEAFLSPVLGQCVAHGIPIIGNFGAANPRAAARAIQALSESLGMESVRVAVVEGDDLLQSLSPAEVLALGLDVEPDPGEAVVAANVYLGAAPIAEALKGGAQVVVTGRVADPALVLGPIMHHFGWSWSDWDRLALGTVAGHLLECGAQVTGGYFADPGAKDVPHLARVGFPIAEIGSDASLFLTKPAGTGGKVTRQTVVEQLLYEIHDPAAYLTPDVTLDVTEVELAEVGPDRVRVSGAKGHPRPPTLKATVSLDGGFLGEGEISYAGPGALGRARLAAGVLQERLANQGDRLRTRIDVVGLSSVLRSAREELVWTEGSYFPDLRVRLAVSGSDRTAVDAATREVLTLYTCGPAGGGGVRTTVRPVIHTASCFVSREQVMPTVSFLGEADDED